MLAAPAVIVTLALVLYDPGSEVPGDAGTLAPQQESKSTKSDVPAAIAVPQDAPGDSFQDIKWRGDGNILYAIGAAKYSR